ncbi:MAG: hypothetical protein DRJ56_03365 [Thermoprotei archaeon]|nr:MAG: hypothetical protein DRJ56_03365 [Thermoprotei archaeon]
MSDPAPCSHVRCRERAVVSLVHGGEVVYLCEEHFRKLQETLFLLAMQYGESKLSDAIAKTKGGRVRVEPQLELQPSVIRRYSKPSGQEAREKAAKRSKSRGSKRRSRRQRRSSRSSGGS